MKLRKIVPFLAILAAPALGQTADSTVTALTNGAPADGSEVFYVVRTSASSPKGRKLDIDDVSVYVASVTGLGDLLGIDLTGLGDGDCLLYDAGTETWAPGSCGGGSGSGTVTSVALTAPSILSVSGSPVTSSGTLALSLATQAANRVFAGPTTGADAAPTFRGLVSADIPNNAANTTGNAATATALAANGGNCSAGQAAAGVDASGAAEGCAAYLTDITGESITDLSDVTALSGNTSVVATTSGTLTSGDCAEFDASGNLVASGGACGGGGSATSIDADGDGTTEVRGQTVSGQSSICLSPQDDGGCQMWASAYSGGSIYSPFFFGGGLFLGTTPALAESHWWLRPLTSTRLSITNLTYGTGIEIGHDGTNPYVDMSGVRYWGRLATAPTCAADGNRYTDTDDGSGNAADCVCLDGGWVRAAGAGACT